MQRSGISVADFEQENASQKQHPILFSFLHNYCLTEKKSLFCSFPFFEKLFFCRQNQGLHLLKPKAL